MSTTNTNPNRLSVNGEHSGPTEFQVPIDSETSKPSTSRMRFRPEEPSGTDSFVFDLPFNAGDKALLETFSPTKDGTEKAASLARARFEAERGGQAERYDDVANAKAQTQVRLTQELAALQTHKQDVPQSEIQSENGAELPKGFKRVQVVALSLAAIALASIEWINAAGFAKNVTQNFGLALIYSTPLLFSALGLKYIIERSSGKRRQVFLWLLGLAGAAAAAGFLASFALQFAAPPSSPEAIAEGHAGAQAWMPMVQLITQLALGITITTALCLWVSHLMKSPARAVPTQAFEYLEQEVQAKERQIHELVSIVSALRGNARRCRAVEQLLVEKYVGYHQAFHEEEQKRRERFNRTWN